MSLGNELISLGKRSTSLMYQLVKLSAQFSQSPGVGLGGTTQWGALDCASSRRPALYSQRVDPHWQEANYLAFMQQGL